MKKIYLISWMAICFLLISFSVINVCAAENYNYASEATVCFLDSKGNEWSQASGQSYPENAIDEDKNTEAAPSCWAWSLKLDLGKPIQFGYISVSFGGYPKIYDISVSDNGLDWTPIIEVSDNTTGGVYDFEIEPVTARYVRIRDNESEEDLTSELRQMSIKDVIISNKKFREVSINLDRTGWSATAYSVHPSFSWLTPDYAINADPEDYWLSEDASVDGNAVHERWFKLDMGELNYINAISMECGKAVDFSPPREMDIWVSTNDKDYTLAAHYSGNGRKKGLFVELDHLYQVRYVKFVLTNADTLPNVWYISDIQCYNSEQTSTEFFLVNNLGEEQLLTSIAAGNVRIKKTISSELGYQGRIIAGLYHKESGILENMVMSDMLSFSEGNHTYSVDLYVDKDKTGLDSFVNNNWALSAIPSFKTGDGNDYFGDASNNNYVTNVNDGDYNTFAVPATWVWQLQLDLGTTHQVGYVNLSFPTNNYPKKFDILISENGIDWEIVKSIEGITIGGTYEYEFNTMNARFLRIAQRESEKELINDGRQMAISEIQVYTQKPADSQYEICSFLWTEKNMIPMDMPCILK